MQTKQPEQTSNSDEPCRGDASLKNQSDARTLKTDSPAVDVEAFELDDIEEIESKVFA